MGLLDGMKEKLGFGDQPEWQDDDAYFDDLDANQQEDEPLHGDVAETPSSHRGPVTFEDYNPNKFSNVVLNSEQEPRVAGYGDGTPAGASGYSSSRSGSYGSNVGTSNARSRDNVHPISSHLSAQRQEPETAGATSWNTPSDPSFLDNPAPAYNRDIYDASIASSDPYSDFDTDVKLFHRDPSTRLKIIMPKTYSDVEKIANAFKAGKSVVLTLAETKPELAKRILDFSFGVACALNGTVDKAAGKVFLITKDSESLSDVELDYLREKGILN